MDNSNKLNKNFFEKIEKELIFNFNEDKFIKLLNQYPKEQSKILNNIANSIEQGIVLIEKDKFIFVNNSFCNLIGYTKNQLTHMKIWKVINSNYKEIVIKHKELRKKKIKSMYEIKIIDINKKDIPVLITGIPVCTSKNPDLFFGLITDLRNQEHIEKLLLKHSTYDDLTGVYNYKSGFDILERVFKYSKRYKKKFTLCFMDTDNLKKINDKFGHSTGDTFLKDFINVIQDSIRESDFIIRVGGDEFLLVLTDANLDTTQLVFERIQKNLNLFNKTSTKYKLSFSYGFSEFNNQSIKEMIIEADNNMYKMKKQKRFK
ncbi:hypothetical protein OSSY52_22260 [Tepiditoga spiralis]|uniref:GGDEF domain-containing protein n=1 Tax=Tepiditoga spiralis TaxID=2108365 RepID=A0A7G1G7A3_9BACT|nr:sensor domain-containing diguanylate cyclase [Tepiditoga spiralis]BBE32085.1 hypothetical protein OSSY52_22260 [Tepiditoga spiralis]